MITLTQIQRNNADALKAVLDQVIKGNQATQRPVEDGLVMYDVEVVMNALARVVAETLDISSTEVRKQRRLNYFENTLLDILYSQDRSKRPPEHA